MVSQSGVFMFGLFLLHAGAILTMLSFSFPKWIEGTTNQTLTNQTSNSTAGNFSSKGLWAVCIGHECHKIEEGQQPGWFKAFQGLYTVGLIGGDLAVLLSYIFCLCATTSKSRTMLNTLSVLLIMIAVAAEVTSIVIFSMHAFKDLDEVLPPLKYGWAYFSSIAGAAITALSGLMYLRVSCHLRSNLPAYESI